MAENKNHYDLDAEEMGSVGTAIREALWVLELGDEESVVYFDDEPAFEGVDFNDGSLLYEVDVMDVLGDLGAMVGAHREAIVTKIKSDCPFISKVDLIVEGSVLKVRCFVDESLTDWEDAPERGRYNDMDMAFVAERAAAANKEATKRAGDFLNDFVGHLRGANKEFDDLMRHFNTAPDVRILPVMMPGVFIGGSGGVDGDGISFYVTFMSKHKDVQRLLKDALKDAGFNVGNEGDGVFVLGVPNEVFRSGLSAYLTRKSVVAGAAEVVEESRKS